MVARTLTNLPAVLGTMHHKDSSDLPQCGVGKGCWWRWGMPMEPTGSMATAAVLIGAGSITHLSSPRGGGRAIAGNVVQHYSAHRGPRESALPIPNGRRPSP